MIFERIKTLSIAHVAFLIGHNGEGTVADPQPLDVAVRPHAAPDAACPRPPDPRYAARKLGEHE